MGVRTISTCVLVALLAGFLDAAQAQAPEITLSEVLRRAAEQHPDIRLAQAEVRVAQRISRPSQEAICRPGRLWH